MDREVRMYFPYYSSITKFDPHLIQTADVAVLGQNLYSRLVSMDEGGEIVGDLADDIRWNGKSYVLRIRRGMKTVDGYEISPHDVALSLRRIFKKDQNTHGSLRPFLAEECIQEDGANIILTPDKPELKTFLIQSLASVDFSIIPAKALDLSQPGWSIVDWRNTTGLYYVHEDSADGRLVLAINPSHHYFSGKQPSVIRLRPGWGADAVEAFNQGEVDIIPTITMASGSAFQKIKGEEANKFESEPIYLSSIRTTSRGLKKLSPVQRLKVGLAIKAALLKSMHPEDGKATEEFFPAFSEGSLAKEQREELDRTLKAASAAEVKEKICLGVYPSRLDDFKSVLAGVPNVEVVPTKGVPPWLEPEERQPDMYFAVTDSGFYESLSLLYYNIDQGTFMDRQEGMPWLENYLKQDKQSRLSLLKDLHLSFLREGRTIPVSVTSYISIARKPWRPQFSKFYAGTPLWKLTI